MGQGRVEVIIRGQKVTEGKGGVGKKVENS